MPIRAPLEIHGLVLTLNEEPHIARCLSSMARVCTSITVIDSGSSDRTVEIAKAHGAEIVSNEWRNYATQMNFGIDHLKERRGWLFRVDSDEYLSAMSAQALPAMLSNLDQDVSGVLVQRQIIFLGRRIRWGGVEPNWQLRLWRCGHGVCEQRWMDEHITVTGRVMKSQVEIVDENLRSIDWWTAKHNTYASREAIDILASRGLLGGYEAVGLRTASPQAKFKRAIKDRIYNRLPGGFRSFSYWLYRYVFRLGFLDGRSGYYFHLLQGLWYRTLVDAKVGEILKLANRPGMTVQLAVEEATGISLSESKFHNGPKGGIR